MIETGSQPNEDNTTGDASSGGRLVRRLGLLGLISTALTAMIGVGINIIPFMIQRAQPGIGAWVPLAFLVAGVPATLAALCYAILSSAMPRAGGSYVYATRALNPLAGFLGSFAQWFGLSIGMGVVAFLMVPMIRDIVSVAGWPALAPEFDGPLLRVPLALASIWFFWWINVRGIEAYQRTVIVMTFAMIVGPVVMTFVGFAADHADFARALAFKAVQPPPAAPLPVPGFGVFVGASVTLFSSFIGFDAVSQAGGEARNATRNLPRAIVIAMAVVIVYYISFTAGVYHAVPWQHIYQTSLVHDVSAPGLMAPLMPRWLVLLVLATVLTSILDSIPSVMLANSRMLFAFGADRIAPVALARVHPRTRTPHVALTATAVCGSISVVGCQMAGEFFLGVDVLILSMLVNCNLMAAAVLCLPRTNPVLYRRGTFLRSRSKQVAIAGSALILLSALLVGQLWRDLASGTPWYFKSTPTWLVVMGGAAVVFVKAWRRLEREGVNPRTTIFGNLPAD